MKRRRAVSFPVWALLLAFGGWMLWGHPAQGAHFDNTVSDLASFCIDCHTLNADLADPDTSFIQASHSTLPTMRSKNGSVAPDTFGCTFCHNDPTRTVNMKTAFGPFDGKPSQHPVDRAFSKDANSNVTLGPNTYSTLYMSNWDNSFVLPASQIGCVDCHDVDANGGSYPNHPVPGAGSRAAGVNPYMLRNTAAMDNNHAPDSFCLQTCHAGTAPGSAGWKMGHYGWGAYDNTTGGMPPDTLKEPSGTLLKTSKCTNCHETHSASIKPNLMGEQKQSSWMIGNTNSYYDPSQCTQCHDETDFMAGGHGKAGISLNCGNCHAPFASHRVLSNPKRLASTEGATLASLTQDFSANGRDDDYDGVVDDGGEAAMQYSAESTCSVTCHSDKHIHKGDIGGTVGSASCLHCHDPHGKGVDNNIMMVRKTIMGRTTNYFTSGTDLFRNDNTSVCDNPSCHAKPLGDTGTPGTIMGDVQEHVDANVSFGTECTSCHSHSSAFGGDSFAPVCNSCHTYPGQPLLAGTHALSPVHNRHIAQDNVGGYGFSCSVCHYKYAHNQSGVNNGGEWNSRFQSNYANIKFEGTWNPKNGNGPFYNGIAADNTLADNVYAPGVGAPFTNGTCAGLYCHGDSDGVAAWPAGTNTQPAWDNAGAPAACGTCHRATATNPPLTFAHQKHADNTTVGYGVSCRKCHYETTSDGITVTSRGNHLNRQSKVSFDTTDALLSSGSYSGTLAVGDSGSTTGLCGNIYCHSPGNRTAAPFDNGALGVPDWKAAGPLACNACHGASGQTGTRVGMPAYPNGSPKSNSHAKHLDDRFTCRVCHWTTTSTDNTIANRSVHVNGAYTSVNDNVARHAFTYSASNCSAAVCHGGWSSGPNMPVWGAGPYACDICHKNTAGLPSAADADQFVYDNGMAKIRADQWDGAVNGSGHGRSSAYPSGNPGAGSRFGTCTANCHTASVGHDNSVNFFRLRTFSGIVDFSDTNQDPGSQQDDNLICLDCHSPTGANPVKATRLVDQNHYGTWDNNKHTASTMGGTFCVDCHDPHGDSNHYMVQDNVTKTSDGVYGIPTEQAPVARFTQQNLDGASGLDGVYDWGDYVKSTSPYTGICQTCHASSGGANYFNTGGSGYTATHNKAGSPPSRCTACHIHTEDFSPSCTSCHGEATAGNGSPPFAPFSGNRIWPATVDNTSNLAGMGNHRSRPASGIDNSGHNPFMASIPGCMECHTDTPGTGADHNLAGNLNATMTNVANHDWYTGAAASWSSGTLDGGVAGGSVVDDSCSNIDCHSPYYGAPPNQYRSGTPMPYTRYWINQTLWDCYTCHAYDGRTATSRPGGADNTMATGMHSAHVGTAQLSCTNCHDVAGYVTTSFTGNHKNGFINWSFAGAPSPYATSPSYSVASGSRAPTDDNTAAGNPSWGSCSNLYCHSSVQASPPSGGTGVVFANPAWDNAQSGRCGTCHAGDGVSGNLTLMATGSHSRHDNAATYAIGCAACHTGAGSGTAAHGNGLIQVPIGNGSWRTFTLTAATTIFDRATAPGTDNADKLPGTAYGRCSAIPCHGDGNGGPPRVTPAVWGDTQAAVANCTYCHGGNAGSGAAMSSGSHTKHVLNSNLPCGKCHDATVSTASDNTITAYDNHVNGQKNVRFSVEVGGTFDNAAKTCSSTYCHGTGPSPAWGSGPIASCSVCHQSQGAGTGASSFTGPHAKHVDNTAAQRYRFACDQCHATNGGQPVTVHAGGDDNTAGPATVEVRFTDNVYASWTYGGAAWNYRSFSLWNNPFGAAAPTPAYADSATQGGVDSVNGNITWSTGSCATVWCHSNANPASAGGGTNQYRSPQWTGTASCTSCHLGADTQANMMGAPDRMSNGHIYHLSIDTYRYTCDECHANTAADNSTTAILDPGGFPFHVNANKRDIRGSSTVKESTVVNTSLAYDNATLSCSGVNNYCHSDGKRQTAPFTARDNTFLWTWNTVPSYGCGSSNKCHASNLGPASTNFTTAGDNSAHTKHPYGCIACHYETQTSPYGTGIGDGLHVNGVKDITISSQAPNIYDNDAIPANNFDPPTKTCSGIACHGGKPVSWTDTNLSCDSCHTTVNNVDVTADVDEFVFATQTPNMSKVKPADYQNRGHGRNGALPWGTGKNPASLFGRAIVCLDCHDKAVAHNVTSNPFRFRATINANAVTFDNVDTVCYACHSSASVKEHSKAVTGGGSSGWEHKQQCVDCHDVHGEGNIFMVHDNIVWQTNGGATYATSDAYGVPYNPASRSLVVFSGNAAGSDYASTDNAAPYNGICEVCHTRTAQYQKDTANGKAGVQSHVTDRCTNCHNHSEGFRASCNACHGDVGGTIRGDGSAYPPEGPVSARSGKTYDWAETQGTVGSRGDHQRHAGASFYNKDCAVCHLSGYGSDPLHNNDKTSATMSAISTFGTWSGGTLAGYQSVTDDSCGNISCHSPYSTENPGNTYRSATPFATGPNAYTRYWIDNVVWDCYTCHAYDGTTATSRPAGADNTMSTGSHTRHVGAIGLACTNCHASGGYTINHKSGFVDWNFANAPNPYGVAAASRTYSGSQLGGTAMPTDNNTGSGHRAYGSCANLYCHSIGQTSTGAGLTGAAGEYRQPMWDNSFGGRCGNCHAGNGVTDNTASVVASGSHTVHAGSAGSLNYPCGTCHNGLGRGAATHVDNAVNLSFGTLGSVSLASTVYSQGASHIVGNGFGNCTVNYCHGTGTPALTGGANQDAAPNLPAWNTPGTALCGSCHGAPGGSTNYPGKGTNRPSSGAHARHLDPADPAGPGITACTDCHTSNSVATHADGRVDFRTRFDNTAATTKALTQTCDPCHGTGVADAKANWDSVTALDCLTCHGATAAYSFANATGRPAPNMAGDNTSYGAAVTGHNKPSGIYGSGNLAAARSCTDCHDITIGHIDGASDNTTYSGNRLLTTVNGRSTGSSVVVLCEACHKDPTGAVLPNKRKINTHGNTGYPDRLEAVFADRTCDQCHEPHGNVYVSTGATGVNLWMINPTITVTSGVTVSPVRLFSKTGTNSFDNTGTASDLCRACHANSNNPGFPMNFNVAGQHAAPSYTGDERGKDCSGCHSHNRDDNTVTVDGLMPLACNECHSYPGLDNTTSKRQMSTGHWEHVGQPLPAGTSGSREFACTLCHFSYTHNQSGYTKDNTWAGFDPANVNVRFDSGWNPGTVTYNGQNAGTAAAPGNGGTGVCAGLYCHGNNATLNAGWGGTATTPSWNGSAACGACHKADSTLAQGNHPAHLTAAFGPGSAAFTASGTCSEGTGCHTAYGLSPTTPHVNNQGSFRTSTGDSTPVGLAATQICRNCHTTYTSANIPVAGDTLARTQANWDNSVYKLSCITCHNGGTGTQASVNIDNTGNRAHNIEATYYSSGHGKTVNPQCSWCHDSTLGHIGTNRPVGTNPWRFGGFISNFTTLGRMDAYCSQTGVCHNAIAPPKDHTWRVDGSGSYGPETKGTTDTHPTTVLAVGTDKDRWYKVPDNVSIPLFGNLMDLNYNKSGGANNYVLCVSCHDPHGVAASPLPSNVRNFSGQNTDAKGNKMLRFNYSSGSPTALCSQCHK